jgi:hypothetical protein
MISGSKMRLDRLCKVLVLAVAFCAAPAWAFDLPELMGLLAKQKSGEARFTEQRFVHGLEGPLDASGTLSFDAPDKLVRRTLSPRIETMASTATRSRSRAAAATARWRWTACPSCSAWSKPCAAR